VADFQGVTGPAMVESDSDSIGCRIPVPGVINAARFSHEANAFAFCPLRAA